MKLYSYYRSSCSYRVRIALNLKGLPYEVIPVHLIKDGGEQNQDGYKKINPLSMVPTLIDGHITLGQSMAIIEYLEETNPQPPLLGESPLQRAACRQLCEAINSGIQPLQNLAVLQKLKGEHGFSDQDSDDWVRHWISRGFTALEFLVSVSAGTYCIGDAPSAADCFLIPQVYNAVRFKVDMGQFPTLSRINEKSLELEAFQKASPESQPDFPG